MDEHGYLFGAEGEEDFVAYYRDYERGQVRELDTTRVGVAGTSRATNADLYVGDFDVFRQDVNWNQAIAVSGMKALASRYSALSSAETCALRAPRANFKDQE